MTKHPVSALERALTDAALSRYQTILDSDPAPVQTSEAYRAYVARLTNKASRRTWSYVNRAWKRVLIAAILMLLLATTVVAAVPALREGLIRFIIHDNGSMFTFEFSQEDLARAPKTIQTYYAPSYVPPQFHLTDEMYDDKTVFLLYEDDTGEIFDFDQYCLWSWTTYPDDSPDVAVGVAVNSENVTVENLIVNGYEVRLIHMYFENEAECLTLLWTDRSYFYLISCPVMEREEIERIIKSVAPVEPK